MPSSLVVVATGSLLLGAVCALTIVCDLALGWKQRMWIMNVVWPVTALWAGPFALGAYFRYGRDASEKRSREAKAQGRKPPNQKHPFAVLAAKGTTHCGAGCSLADIIAEWVLVAIPLTLFGKKIFGAWAVDYVLALLIGIAFQYFTIKPMKGLSRGEGLKEAAKADFLSLTAWQVGMYGWMAVATFGLFGRELDKTAPVFWFMMQIAMFLGFFTAYPVNWWLLKRGVKERM